MDNTVHDSTSLPDFEAYKDHIAPSIDYKTKDLTGTKKIAQMILNLGDKIASKFLSAFSVSSVSVSKSSVLKTISQESSNNEGVLDVYKTSLNPVWGEKSPTLQKLIKMEKDLEKVVSSCKATVSWAGHLADLKGNSHDDKISKAQRQLVDATELLNQIKPQKDPLLAASLKEIGTYIKDQLAPMLKGPAMPPTMKKQFIESTITQLKTLQSPCNSSDQKSRINTHIDSLKTKLADLDIPSAAPKQATKAAKSPVQEAPKQGTSKGTSTEKLRSTFESANSSEKLEQGAHHIWQETPAELPNWTQLSFGSTEPKQGATEICLGYLEKNAPKVLEQVDQHAALGVSFSLGGAVNRYGDIMNESAIDDVPMAKSFNVGNTKVSLFGVFDGGGENGYTLSLYLAEKIPTHLEENLPKILEIPDPQKREAAIAKLLEKARQKFSAEFKENHPRAVSEASFAVVIGNDLWVANSGNSRAILSSNGTAMALSEATRRDDARVVKIELDKVPPGQKHLVIGSKGLIGSSKQIAVKVAQLDKDGKNPSEISSTLVHYAHSTDKPYNITALVVDLSKLRPSQALPPAEIV